ncbi:hypothetical protein PACTADRAFT_5045 [Pachysolen tannophilus NRRL Y-2460]|uniref:Uncharacterized protein n=1 Tax=Pachysolen tannophilus NRRL Y-2460 TaxID=669874 RepID=A0A1E4TNC0_PACTA|nr:hypothetical protein PACTADRAFT_5045 [Pachysolen tannophilus NRRL Y-2460]
MSFTPLSESKSPGGSSLKDVEEASTPLKTGSSGKILNLSDSDSDIDIDIDDDQSSIFNDKKNDMLSFITNTKAGNSSAKRKISSFSDNEDEDLGLGFSLKVQKADIPQSFKREVELYKKSKELSNLIKRDEEEAVRQLREKETFQESIRLMLSAQALNNEGYINKRSLLDFDEIFAPVDAELAQQNIAFFAKISDSTKLSKIAGSRNIKKVQSFNFFSRNLPIDDNKKDFLKMKDIESYLKNIGCDLKLLDIGNLTNSRKINDQKVIPSYILTINKLEILVNLVINETQRKFNRFDNRALKTTMMIAFEKVFFKILKILILAMIDSRINSSNIIDDFNFQSPSYQLCEIFDRFLKYYITVNLDINDDDIHCIFKTLCQKFRTKLIVELTDSKELISRYLSRLLYYNRMSYISKVLTYWMVLSVIVEDDEITSSKEILTYEFIEYHASTPLKFNEMIMKKLLKYLNGLQEINFEPGEKRQNYRENLQFYLNLKYKFKFINDLILINVSYFRTFNNLNEELENSQNNIEEKELYSIYEESKRDEKLALTFKKVINSIEKNYFKKIDMNNNPILGWILNLLNNLAIRISKELTLITLEFGNQ